MSEENGSAEEVKDTSAAVVGVTDQNTADAAGTQAEAAAAAPETETVVTTTLEKIEAWFKKHFHDSIVSKDVAVFNAVHAAVEELKTDVVDVVDDVKKDI